MIKKTFSFIISVLLIYLGYESYDRFGGMIFEVLKKIWPILAFITVITLLIVPFANYLLNLIYNEDIERAKREAQQAKKEAQQAKYDAIKQINDVKRISNQHINDAHNKEKKICRDQLDAEWTSLHEQKNNVLFRENAIQERERAARSLAEQAQNDIQNSEFQINIMREQFNDEAERLRKAARNATHAYHRKKRAS